MQRFFSESSDFFPVWVHFRMQLFPLSAQWLRDDKALSPKGLRRYGL